MIGQTIVVQSLIGDRVLRNGTKFSAITVATVVDILKVLRAKWPWMFYVLVTLARHPGHDLDGLPFTILAKLGLIDVGAGGLPYVVPSVHAIIDAAVDSGPNLELRDPFAKN
jgi:hypothetical protein